MKKIFALLLTVCLLFAGCQKTSPPQSELIWQNAAKAIKERDGAQSVEILFLEPAPQSPEYYALARITDPAGLVSPRFYHLSKGENSFTVLSPYYCDSQPDLAISVSHEIIGNNTVVYGEINYNHTSSKEQAFIPMDVSQIDVRLETGGFSQASLYEKAYLCVFPGKRTPLAQVVFYDTPEGEEEPISYDYQEEMDYLLSLTPQPVEGPLYQQYEEGSDLWVLNRYVYPLAFSGLLAGESWSDASQLSADGLTQFAAGLPSLDENTDYSLFWDNEQQAYQVPASYVEERISAYFSLPEEFLRQSSRYLSQEDAYLLPDMDFSGEAFFQLESVEPLENGSLQIQVSSYQEEPTEDSLPDWSYLLTVQPEEESFRYLSCNAMPVS